MALNINQIGQILAISAPNVELGSLIELVQSQSLLKSYENRYQSMAGQPVDKQKKAMQEWCDTNLGINYVTVESFEDAPVSVRINAHTLRGALTRMSESPISVQRK